MNASARTAEGRGREVLTRGAAISLAATVLLATTAHAAGPQMVGPLLEREGPSSSQTPYLNTLRRNMEIRSLLTTGDSVGGYRFSGIPDGIGAFRNDDGTFTILVNHELTPDVGGPHDHAASGAFVSRWTVRRSDFKVLSGGDLIQAVATYDTSAGQYDEAAYGVLLGRLCSADLPKRAANYDISSGLGFRGRLLMNGEEVGTEGRAFGTVAHGTGEGTAYELPSLGNMSFENVVANPGTGTRTVVMEMDDSTPGELYVYTGDKKASGNAVERAGLTDGRLWGIKVEDAPVEDRTAGIGGPSRPFTLAALGDVAGMTGADLQTASTAAGVTQFLRPEDGSWDPTNLNVFYFVTTDRFNTVKRPGQLSTPNTPPAQDGRTRLWRLRFHDRTQPELGGTISELLDGGTGQAPVQMLDNITVDGQGRILMQEDPGNQAHSARIWRYDPHRDRLTAIAQHDVDRFGDDRGKLPRAPFTQDEESSGIVDASRAIGKGWFLLDVQAHYPNPDPALVEGGQLLVMYAP